MGARVRIESDASGLTGLHVNDVDLTANVAGLQVTLQPGDTPIIDLRLTGVQIEGLDRLAGVVRVIDETAPDEAIGAFLDNLDPGVIDKLVLERLGWGDGMSPVGLTLTVLRELVANARTT